MRSTVKRQVKQMAQYLEALEVRLLRALASASETAVDASALLL
jgi:hypothetical protein